MILIDGSVMEGGGQIIRLALSFSALTKTPIKISNIRANRKKGGLAAQHLQGVNLIKKMCNAKVTGGFMGSTEIEFLPGNLNGGKYYADMKTAGSIALLLQLVLPVSYFCNAPVKLELKGGTNAEMAPQIDFITEILRPNIEKFDATFDFQLLKRGYYPRGGGHTIVDINPIKYLRPVEIVDFGEIENFFGWSFVAGQLSLNVAKEMSDGAKQSLKSLAFNKSIDIEHYKERADIARDDCSGIILGCKTTTNCNIGGSALGERKSSNFDTGKRAANEIIDAISIKSCVDEHVQDQLIVFMALAKGKSRIRTQPLTLHTKTAIYISELLTKAKFNIIEEHPTFIIECNGIGLESI